MDTDFPLQDAWTRARNRYVEDLSEEEKHIYYQASLERICYDASASKKTHAVSGTARNAIKKIQPLVEAIQQYGQALDVYTNTYPLVIAPLWDSIRLLLHVSIYCLSLEDRTKALSSKLAKVFGKYFEKLVDMLARIGDILPRFRLYEVLFSSYEQLVQALSASYFEILRFCVEAKAVFRRGKKSSCK